MKFIEFMLSEVIFGFVLVVVKRCLFIVMFRLLLVEMFIIVLVVCLIMGRNFLNVFGCGLGFLVCGLCVCRWMIEVLVFVVLMLVVVIFVGVIGKCGDMDGV